MENSSGRISKRRFREEKKGGLEKGKDTSGGVFGSEVWKKMRDGEVGEKGWGMELDERVARLRKEEGGGKER